MNLQQNAILKSVRARHRSEKSPSFGFRQVDMYEISCRVLIGCCYSLTPYFT